MEQRPVPVAGFNELIQFRQLGDADSRLHIGHLQVVANVGVGVLVVVPIREPTELPVEPSTAGVVTTGRAPTVTAPVAE